MVENKSTMHIRYPEADSESWSNNDLLIQDAFLLARSNFPHLTFFLEEQPEEFASSKEWEAYAFKDAATVFINGAPEWVFKNSILIRTDMDEQLDLPNVDDIYRIANGRYLVGKSFGSGSKTYKVTAVLRDEYTLDVKADSEEEAVDLAFNINIADWKHEEIEPHLTERAIVRMARWGNLSAEEVE